MVLRGKRQMNVLMLHILKHGGQGNERLMEADEVGITTTV